MPEKYTVEILEGVIRKIEEELLRCENIGICYFIGDDTDEGRIVQEIVNREEAR